MCTKCQEIAETMSYETARVGEHIMLSDSWARWAHVVPALCGLPAHLAWQY